MQEHSSSSGNGRGTHEAGNVVRISTALGTYVVVVINELGRAADGMTREIEQDVLRRMRSHREITQEMNTVEVQRGELATEVIEW
jgi:hypothetical protein